MGSGDSSASLIGTEVVSAENGSIARSEVRKCHRTTKTRHSTRNTDEGMGECPSRQQLVGAY